MSTLLKTTKLPAYAAFIPRTAHTQKGLLHNAEN